MTHGIRTHCSSRKRSLQSSGRIPGADGEPVADASVTVLQPSRAGLSPVDAFLVRSETGDNGVLEDAVLRLHGLTVIVDHPAHLPFVAAYPSRPPRSRAT